MEVTGLSSTARCSLAHENAVPGCGMILYPPRLYRSLSSPEVWFPGTRYTLLQGARNVPVAVASCRMESVALMLPGPNAVYDHL